MNIKTQTLKRALAMLDAIGATYAVLYETQKYGTLDLAPDRQRRMAAFDNEAKFGYIRSLDALQPGGVLQYTCDSYEEAMSLRGSLGSRGVRLRGPGGVTTHLYKNDAGTWTVEVMAVLPAVHSPGEITLEDRATA